MAPENTAAPAAENPARWYSKEQIENDRRVLELLSQTFGTISAASSEIINLEAYSTCPRVQNIL